MPLILSNSLNATAFARLALQLARQGADMLLCHHNPHGGGMPHGWQVEASDTPHHAHPCCIIGLHPQRELVITPTTPDTALHHFCFGDTSCHADLTLGFLSYPLGLLRHGIATSKDNALPLGTLRTYQSLLRWYPHNATLTLATAADSPPDAAQSLQALLAAWQTHQPATDGLPPELTHPLPPASALPQSLDRKGYMRGVTSVLQHIRKGNTYQLNLTSSFGLHVPGFDAPAFFLRRWLARPVPHAGFFHCGPYRIISFSPERFLHVAKGEVRTMPIKGTRQLPPQGTPPAATGHPNCAEARLRAELMADPKERAELSMVVDLLRNDISTTCAYGSVRVTRHCEVFRVGRLLQMFSEVRGTLAPEHTCLDLLLSAFPGGSVTGCPKPRTMEIIDSLEPHSREVYCGTLLAIADAHTMDSSIAIRTGWYDTRTGALTFPAGSGLTVDSCPADEYDEAVAKTAAFREPWLPKG